ncbi:MAG: hypothetical protein JSW08_01865 [archaeon]|nr:MAG: hypothetical protein JSW08_01865 [archaeon]
MKKNKLLLAGAGLAIAAAMGISALTNTASGNSVEIPQGGTDGPITNYFYSSSRGYPGDPAINKNVRITASSRGDTINTTSGNLGEVTTSTSSFTPPLTSGDTIYFSAVCPESTSYNVNTHHIIDSDFVQAPAPGRFDNPHDTVRTYTPSIQTITDTTGVTGPIDVIYGPRNSAVRCTTSTDSIPTYGNHDWVGKDLASYLGTSISPGDTIDLTLEKALGGDTVAVTDTFMVANGSEGQHLKSVTMPEWYSYPITDLGITRILAPTDTIDSIPFNPRVEVKNFGNTPATAPVTMLFDSDTSYHPTIQPTTIQPGDSTIINFPQFSTMNRGNNLATSYIISPDNNPSNDTLTKPFFTRIEDIRVPRIADPLYDIDSTNLVIPGAQFRNEGNVPTTFRAFFTIGNPPFYQDDSSFTMNPGASWIHRFDRYTGTPRGLHPVKCSVALDGDLYPGNNVADTSVFSHVRDSKLEQITSPGSMIVLPMGEDSADIRASAVVNSIGNDTIYGQRVTFGINDAATHNPLYEETTLAQNIPPGQTREFGGVSIPIARVPIGSFYAWARTNGETVGDMNRYNDSIAKPFTVSRQGAGEGWREVASVPLGPSGRPVKRGGWATTLDGMIYAAKGYKTSDFYVYNPTLDMWDLLPPIVNDSLRGRPPKKGAKGISDGVSKIYYTVGNNTQAFREFDTETGVHTGKAVVPLGPRGKKVKGGTDMQYVVQNDTGYVYLLKGYKDEFYRYNTITDQWQDLENIPSYRGKVNKGSWLVFNGEDNKLHAHTAKYHDHLTFDLGTMRWEGRLEGMPFIGRMGRRKKSKDGGSAVKVGNNIYALKGGNTQEFWKYDVGDSSWTELDTVPAYGSTGRKKRVKYGADLVEMGGFFYTAKGNKTAEFWRCVPSVFGPSQQQGRTIERTVTDPNVQTEDVLSGRYTYTPSIVRQGTEYVFNRAVDGSRYQVVDPTGRIRDAGIAYEGKSLPRDLNTGIYIIRTEKDGNSGTSKLVVTR